MKTALITGIRGAVGSYLAEHLLSQGVQVYGMARPECDMRFPAAVLDKLVATAPEVIYHMAAHADVAGSWREPAACLANNIASTVNLFEAVRKVCPQSVIVLCSTSEVYGSPENYPAGEEWPLAPINPYAVSKATCDLYAQMMASAYGLRVVITRAFGYINPRRDDLSLSSFARQIVAIERGRQAQLRHGNLDSVRTWCDVRDLVRAYALAPGLPPVNGHRGCGIYNIGSEEAITVWQTLLALLQTAGMDQSVCIADPDLMRPADIGRQIPRCDKFHRATNWRPTIALRESLSWLLDCYRSRE